MNYTLTPGQERTLKARMIRRKTRNEKLAETLRAEGYQVAAPTGAEMIQFMRRLGLEPDDWQKSIIEEIYSKQTQ